MTHKTIILFVWIFFSFAVYGQFINTIEFSKEEVLLYSRISGMHEDVKGYLWIYGDDGIARYNGHHFERLENLFPQAEALPSKNCTALSTSQNELWFAIRGAGLYRINSRGRLQSFEQISEKDSTLRSKRIKQLVSFNDLLFSIGDKGFESFVKKNGLYHNLSLSISNPQEITGLYLHSNFLWLIGDDRLIRLDTIDLSTREYPGFISPRFFNDLDNRLWISHIPNTTEIMYLDETSLEFIPHQYQPYKTYKKSRNFVWLNKQKLLSYPELDIFMQIADYEKESIEHIDEKFSGIEKERFLKEPFRDSKGQIWLFGEQLYMIPKNDLVQTAFASRDEELINDMVIYGGVKYISIRNKGLHLFNEEGIKLEEYNTSNSKIADNFISQIVDFGKGRFGLCLMNFFQIYDTKTGFEKPIPVDGITRSAFENNDYIWIGGFKDVYKYKKSNGSLRKIVIPAEYPKEGNPINGILNVDSTLFLASASGGYSQIQVGSDSIDLRSIFMTLIDQNWWDIKTNHADLSPSKHLIAMATDNGLYISKPKTFSGVLDLYESDSKNKLIKTNHHFFTNVVFLNDSILYATTRDKVLRVNLMSSSVETYGSLQGVLNNTFILRSSYKDKNNRIYFGGDRGIDMIDGNLRNDTKELSDLHIDQIFHNGIRQFPDLGKVHKVPPGVNMLEIKVNNPRSTLGESAIIKGRLSSNPTWTELSDDNIFTVYNPNPGILNFEFVAVDSDSNFLSQIIKQEIKILQKWYLKIWFWVIIGLIAIGGTSIAMFQIQRKKNERTNRDLKLQEELASLRLTSLNSQMNPHFIFNALSSIQQLITSGETETAEEYLSKFSRLLRHVIQYASHKNVSLEEEISFLRNYLELELLRFDNAFEFTIETDVSDVKKIKIPPFFIQPQAENAIKHGLLNNGKDNKLKIKFKEKNKQIIINIEDNGIGRKASSEKSIYQQVNTKKGNYLTEERIENLNKLNHKSSFRIEDLIENGKSSGTRVTLIFEFQADDKDG